MHFLLTGLAIHYKSTHNSILDFETLRVQKWLGKIDRLHTAFSNNTADIALFVCGCRMVSYEISRKENY